jgi:hypothetical protein
MDLRLVKRYLVKVKKKSMSWWIRIWLHFRTMLEIYYLRLLGLKFKLLRKTIIIRIILDMKGNRSRRSPMLILIGLSSRWDWWSQMFRIKSNNWVVFIFYNFSYFILMGWKGVFRLDFEGLQWILVLRILITFE